MLESLNLIRNVGRFDSFTNGSNHPFAQLTLIYAENGQGKTTLSAILRSLATGDSTPISERRRLAAQHPPHVIVSCIGGPPDAMFQDGAWNRVLEDVVIFDDVFVDENVYSGLVVGSDHRQNLHELILGAQGVALNQQLQTHIARIEQHNSELRRHSSEIPADERGRLSVDQFCDLPPNPNIDQEIQTAEQNLAASRQQDRIRNAPELQLLDLPEIDLPAIEAILELGLPDIDTAAAERVQAHLQSIGEGAERWVGEGVIRQNSVAEAGGNKCVFCAQDISQSAVIDHYRAFFSAAYRSHQEAIRSAESSFNRTHSEGAALPFERSIRTLAERRQFWSEFGEIPELAIDSAAITSDWNAARAQIAQLFQQKRAAPLDAITLPDEVHASIETYNTRRNEVAALNQQIASVNQMIATVKQQAATASATALTATLTRLKATKARYTPTTDARCQAYLEERQAKGATEQQRDQARQALDQYRTQVFPEYEAAINRYLERFNAGYRLERVQPVNTRGGPTCSYSVVVNNTAVTVTGGNAQAGEPSFRNILSAGDRNTLAIAFFLASIELDPNQAGRVVVIDDPVSSLDEHRSLTTIQEVRRLLSHVGQIVILSHSKPFLCRLWESVTPASKTALQVARQANASTITQWDVNADSETDNDRRHQALRYFLRHGGQNEKEIAAAIRPCLEAFLRVAYPEHYPPGTLLGPFREKCSQRVGTHEEILRQADIDELRDLVDYANVFHHDTNPAWETEVVNSAQLEGFVRRTLEFAKRS
ncbi:AAA family ATPase [Salinisphaera sp. P385]|uniref:AAA family ATPase n=1 Tax=Spectribacter acetivorans TaxID=3075603 RepID=A0ABU3BAN3_9GAMM|nr:AAA family ATPase [Salinisphaera sp. P385]MDT0619527.1 AAA family ATPase [Salinisphaera sp. P385]